MITATRVSSELVASHVPPSPTSTTATSTARSANHEYAAAVSTSKYDGCSSSASSTTATVRSKSSSSSSAMGIPWYAIRSLTCSRCGLVYEPTARPTVPSNSVTMRAVDVFPFVPVRCTAGYSSWGDPRYASNASMRSRVGAVARRLDAGTPTPVSRLTWRSSQARTSWSRYSVTVASVAVGGGSKPTLSSGVIDRGDRAPTASVGSRPSLRSHSRSQLAHIRRATWTHVDGAGLSCRRACSRSSAALLFGCGAATAATTPHGSAARMVLNRAIVDIGPTPSGNGYWLVATDGGIFAFGDARFLGSTGGHPSNQPIVGIAATPTGNGYWLAASDGGIFAFGDARFYGSTGATRLNRPDRRHRRHTDGNGYWLVASDGGIFAFGDARFFGSTGAMHLNRADRRHRRRRRPATATGSSRPTAASSRSATPASPARPAACASTSPITGIATAHGGGYWLVGEDGGVFAFGGAPFLGSASAAPPQPSSTSPRRRPTAIGSRRASARCTPPARTACSSSTPTS